MNQEEMKNEFSALYDLMAVSNNVAFMGVFGSVHKEMMCWMIQNKPELAQGWIEKLESIRWKNYLTRNEAEQIVAGMTPEAPWSLEKWKGAMERSGFDLEDGPYYNRYALFVTMNMIMSDSAATIAKYVSDGELFGLVHDLGVDKLTDKDGVFNVRRYFGV